MKKSKGQTIDLLYNSNKKENKKSNKKNIKKKSKNKKQINNTINLDNEIIIGLTPKKEEKTKNQKNKKNIKNKKKNSKGAKTKKEVSNKKKIKKSSSSSSKTNSNNKKKVCKKGKIILKIIKWTCLIVLLALAIIIFMRSSLFNIKEIKVINNEKLSAEEIINLSSLESNSNMFKTTKRRIIENIKTNAYIETVKVKRSITGVITLDIIERKPTYMLKFANAYVYINNQGYMLEITETPLELTTITGFLTSSDEIKEGNRLIVEDLKKLEDVIKIMNSAKDLSLINIITNVDISEDNNYKLTIESENKIVYFGDTTNINVKLLRIEEIIEKEKGIEGEIYFQNSEKTVFREKV